VVAVDLPGHGGSSDIEASLWDSAKMVTAVGGSSDYLGYSLGGRVLLHGALANPDLVRRVVLIGATAGIEDTEARAQRRRDDEALADQLSGPDNQVEPEDDRLRRFLRAWMAGPLFATLPAESTFVEARMTNRCHGLAMSLRRCGTGTQQPLWDRLTEIQMPVLVVAGALDFPFADRARQLVEAIGPNALLAIVPDAGHACHLEQPSVVAGIVEDFLS
jgi:2-succinyl-6-hydroxy-2,4-cyclohexadiene-1-carboxylate synthase